MPEGVDISEHQGDLPPEWFDQWEFCIIRSDSGYRKDFKFDQNWKNAKGRTRRGVYHYLVHGNIAAQATRTLQWAYEDDPDLLWWCDAEDPGVTVDDVLGFCMYLEGSGKTVGLYSYVPFLTGALGSDPRLQRFPLWIAGYGPNDGTRHPLDPAPPWPWVIHQYSSGTGLDLNYAPTLDFAGAPTPEDEMADPVTIDGQTLYGLGPNGPFPLGNPDHPELGTRVNGALVVSDEVFKSFYPPKKNFDALAEETAKAVLASKGTAATRNANAAAASATVRAAGT